MYFLRLRITEQQVSKTLRLVPKYYRTTSFFPGFFFLIWRNFNQCKMKSILFNLE